MTGRRQRADGVRWDGVRWDGVRWDGVTFGVPRPATSSADGLRIGDAERDAAAAALGEHFAAGRLTRSELDDRTTAAWAARTRAELAPLFTDLPQPHGDGAPAPAPPPGQVVAAQPRRRFPWLLWVVAVIVLHVATGVPWVLLAVALWLALSWLRDWGRPRHSRRFAAHGAAGPGPHAWCGRGAWTPR